MFIFAFLKKAYLHFYKNRMALISVDSVKRKINSLNVIIHLG